MIDDTELLRRYVEASDELAFAELVQRHVSFVHSAALRQVNGDAHLAADVTQLVFVDLARKARVVVGYRVLAGWLFTSTRFTAAKIVRSERRRRGREQEAQMRHELSTDAAASLDWARVRAVLDDVLGELSAADREAVLLRYFENRDFNAIGAKLNLAGNTARMRVDRALEKLRERLARRGVTSTTAALAAALASHAVLAAPAGLAASVTGAALAGGTAAAGATSAFTLFMSMTKLQMGLTGALVVAVATGLAVQAKSNTALRAEIATLQQDNAAQASLAAENGRLQRTANEVAELRNDSAEFARLGGEVKDLKARLETVTQRDAAPVATEADDVYDMSALDQVPRVVSRVAPQYPFEMRRAGVNGEVTVEFIVDQNGDVRDAIAVKSSRREFEAAAVQAVANWKFSAGRKGGRYVNTRMQVPIVFRATKTEGTAGTPTPAN